MEKVPTKKLLGISAIVWGIVTFFYFIICALDYGSSSYNESVNVVLLSAADPDSTVGAGDKNIPAGHEAAIKIGKMVRAKYDQGINPERLTELSREMRPFVEKKLESLAIQDVSAIFKTLPADLDTAKFIVSLSDHGTWHSLMRDKRDKARLLQVLKKEKTGLEAVNSKDSFLLYEYIFILIAQALGFLIYILIFYTHTAYTEFGKSYIRYVKKYGVWHNLNWKNPLVWVCVLPSSLPLLIVLAFIKILGNISSWNKHDKDTGKSHLQNLTGHSDDDTKNLAQKLQESIGGVHAKRDG